MEDFKENGSVTAEEDEQGSTTDSSRIEKSKLVIMRAFVEREDPSSKDVDDCTLRRFLRARDLEVEKASKMFLKHLIWRRSFVPNGSITLPEITNEVVQNKLFVQGHDKKGRPLMVVFGNRHRPSMSNLDEFKRFIVYALDTICSRVSPGEEKFVAIADLQGWGYSNSDIRGYITALSILQDSYPERLGRLFLVHVPYVFMTAWKMVYPFIDSKTKKKISFIENKKLRATLLAEIDENQLPDVYGGKLPLVAVQDI